MILEVKCETNAHDEGCVERKTFQKSNRFVAHFTDTGNGGSQWIKCPDGKRTAGSSAFMLDRNGPKIKSRLLPEVQAHIKGSGTGIAEVLNIQTNASPGSVKRFIPQPEINKDNAPVSADEILKVIFRPEWR